MTGRIFQSRNCGSLDLSEGTAAQVGSHAARKFAERLAPSRLSPPHAGILGVLRKSGGLSQQGLAEALHMHPSGLVAIIDELEERGLVKAAG